MSEPVSLRGLVAELGEKLTEIEAERASLKAENAKLSAALAAAQQVAIERVIEIIRNSAAIEQSSQHPLIQSAVSVQLPPAPPPPPAAKDFTHGCPTCGGVLIAGQCYDCEEREQMARHSRPKVKEDREPL